MNPDGCAESPSRARMPALVDALHVRQHVEDDLERQDRPERRDDREDPEPVRAREGAPSGQVE